MAQWEAIKIGMKSADVLSSVYLLSPGCISPPNPPGNVPTGLHAPQQSRHQKILKADFGTKAQLAWATVHLALLPTNEDRAKAVVDWAGATFSHQRAGRITVENE